MTDRNETRNGKQGGSQVGVAVVGLSVAAACGVAWLAGSPKEDEEAALSYGPSSTYQSSPDQVTVAGSGSGAAIAPQQIEAAQAANVGSSRDFALIVRFDGEQTLDEIGKTFRRDPEGSRERFTSWAADKPALQGLILDRASYSGELVLTGSGARTMKDAIAAIEAMDNVAYVEPDYSAEPGKEG